MKKNYEAPILEEQEVEIEDIIAASNNIFGKWAGDFEAEWPFSTK